MTETPFRLNGKGQPELTQRTTAQDMAAGEFRKVSPGEVGRIGSGGRLAALEARRALSFNPASAGTA
ncbi:hypothetical protein W02_00860 [Nitrospira sp. KM1]|nr:hypothetical protein W02_00860 [Nitrospira sp. KM1]